MPTKTSVPVDSGVYQEGQGYERILLVRDWNANDRTITGRVHLRVDRVPEFSFAKFEVWDNGLSDWRLMFQLAPSAFWSEMPGYLRWARDTSESKTWGLAMRLRDQAADKTRGF